MTIDLAEERSLVQALKLGDHRAFERLYHWYSGKLYWKLTRMLNNESEAAELLQDLFVRVWERRQQINEDFAFGAFLTGIAKNMVIDYYRKIARMRSTERELSAVNSELIDHTEQIVFSKEAEFLIKKAIDHLPEQRKMAFKLCKIEGKSHKEAAEIMQISPNTVHNHLVKATQSVKEFIHSQHLSNPISLVVALSILFNQV